MSRPLQANPKRNAEAQSFHRAVFAAHGFKCHFCGNQAVDAMHVVGRSNLGKHRYAFAVQNGRPGCRPCHMVQTNGDLQFSLADRRAAVKALNSVLTVKLPEPF